MNSNLSKPTICAALLTGTVLWIGMALKFEAEEKLSYEPNVACLKGSPYGKIMALALQGPIDLWWHKGTTHKHVAINHDHDEGCSDACHGHHGPETTHDEETQTLHAWKEGLKRMEANTYRKTSGRNLSKAHAQFIQDETEDKLRLAYELDPTNFTNYGNYHFFLAMNELGRADADHDAALSLALKTLDVCKEDEVDPASWLTAASAAFNIAEHIAKNNSHYTIVEAKGSLAEFDFCIQRHEFLLKQAWHEGRVISSKRIEEMNARKVHLMKLRKALGVTMKRLMSEANNQPGGISTQTAGSLIHQGVNY